MFQMRALMTRPMLRHNESFISGERQAEFSTLGKKQIAAYKAIQRNNSSAQRFHKSSSTDSVKAPSDSQESNKNLMLSGGRRWLMSGIEDKEVPSVGGRHS
jgi:hypothetical protein